ncbi:MAG: PQQ-dependent sugar dehydrogenase [Chloroflexi bacterium]|nr:PQQ-dependent sugar dehydrogenase [Chloroflexota bacterium]
MRTRSAARLCIGLLALSLLLAACGGGSGGDAAPTVTSTVRPDETPAPATSPADEPPAELGYRLVGTLPAATIEEALGFAVVPGAEGQAVIITQRGRIWRISLDGAGEEPAPFGNLSDKLKSLPSLEEGLLGLAFSPQFELDGRVFVYYTADEPRRSVISWFPVANDALELADEHIVIEVPQPAANHNGGQLAFGPDGYLYVALGDGGGYGDPNRNGQDPSTLLGAILRLDVSGDGYTVPPDNPFVGTPGVRPEIFAYGFRNPWRFSFDRETGELWAADVGQDKWEETDRVVAGGNYGWDELEGLECFRDGCSQDGFVAPRSVYDHSEGVAVIGGFVYRGRSLPRLAGWYIYGDWESGKVWGVNTADESPPVLLAEADGLITSFGELPDGELIVLTFNSGIFRLTRLLE